MAAVHYYLGRPARVWISAHSPRSPARPARNGSGRVHSGIPGQPATGSPRSGSLTVSAGLTNGGTVAGDDVVQLYIRQDGTTILQPVRRLDGFQRVTLAPGQTKTITFRLAPGNIGFHTNTPGQFVVQPGTVDVYVGDSSADGLHGQFTVTG